MSNIIRLAPSNCEKFIVAGKCGRTPEGNHKTNPLIVRDKLGNLICAAECVFRRYGNERM